MTINIAEFLAQIADVEAAFIAVGEDPRILAPDFIPYHLKQGKTAADILAIALSKPETTFAPWTV